MPRDPVPDADRGKLMGDPSSRTNRLAGESSPYLLLHRHNPVDWYAWGQEAITRAKSENRPIFLSVGYSTCYWCHVMERESFSDPAIAEPMNRHFVNIKVDREERPELDEIYMTATQILTHRGGWPNSVFLTPELKPFFAGTYFPPVDRHGQPGFPTVVASLAEAWRSRRSEVLEQAEEVARAMQRYLEAQSDSGGDLPTADMALSCLTDLERQFDSRWGGFGGAPKFPTPSNLMLLAELADEQPRAADMLATTLDQMARGGIFDQLGGGFHRYATDREWKIPHFEKMLYDNGLLLEVYAREWARTGDLELARIVRQTATFLEREMSSEEGAFLSALDAETDGHEGAYYVWSRGELQDALGAEDFEFLAPLLGFSGAPFFEQDRYVLHLPQPLVDQALRRRLELTELLAQIEPMRAALLAMRSRRRAPALDDKVLADWNGMAISGLAAAGRLLPEPRLVRRAATAADFLLAELRPGGGPLLHTWRAGKARIPAFLSDYVFLIGGLLALHDADGNQRWLEAAEELALEQQQRLADPSGGYFVAAPSAEVLFRSKEVMDGAVPGANAVAVLNLLQLAKLRPNSQWQRLAELALRVFALPSRRVPAALKTLAVATRRFHRSPGRTPDAVTEVAGAGTASGELVREAGKLLSAGLELGPADAEGWRTFRLRLRIAPGWHVAAPQATAVGEPLLLEGRGVELRSLRFPRSETLVLAASDVGFEVYVGEPEVVGELRLSRAADGAVIVRFQACDESRCLPQAQVEIPVPSSAA